MCSFRRPSSLLALLSLILHAIVSHAAPAPGLLEVGTIAGHRIPLVGSSKEGVPLTNDDGTANVDALQRQIALTKAKYQATIAAYLHNTGNKLGEMLPQDVYNNSTSSYSSMPNTNAAAASQRREKRQSERLTNMANDLLWAGSVSIGTPRQHFNIMFDTGSSDFWVPSSSPRCTSCSGNKYDSDLSTTSEERSGSFAIYYGDGSSTSGPIFTDDVQIGDFVAEGHYFSPVTSMSDSFASEPEDGIMGMAYSSISSIRSRRQSPASAKPFGLRVAKTSLGASELYLGGANPNQYTGPIEWHPVQKLAYYNISGRVFLEGSDILRSPRSTIIDSGTTVIVAPPADAAAFWANVPGSAKVANTAGYYSYPCTSPPRLSFTFGDGKRWSVSAGDMNLGRVSKSSTQCVGAVAGVEVGLQGGWILGCSFLKNVYTVFNPVQNVVGFAKLL